MRFKVSGWGQQLARAVQVKAGSLKFRKTVQNEQLCNKLTVENWIFTEYVASEKYRSVLEACHQGKSKVGTTHRNRYGYDLFNSAILISFFLGRRKKFRNLDVFLFQHNIRYCVCTVVYFLYLSETFHPASNCKKLVRFWLKIYVVLKGEKS